MVPVDAESGLPVRVEVMYEEGEVFTTIDHSDCGAPVELEFPKRDENE